MIPARIFPAFVPESFLTALPNIYIPDCWIGITNYIDEADKLTDNNSEDVRALKGVDKYNRSAICFHVWVEYENAVVEKAIYTLFQRYTDDHSTWVCCASHRSTLHNFTFIHKILETVLVNETAAQMLNTLFTHGTLHHNGYTVDMRF